MQFSVPEYVYTVVETHKLPITSFIAKRRITWGQVEEESWQMLKAISTKNLRLTIPDPMDNLIMCQHFIQRGIPPKVI